MTAIETEREETQSYTGLYSLTETETERKETQSDTLLYRMTETEKYMYTWPRLDLKLSVDDDQLERDFSMFAYNEDDVASLWTSDKVIKMLEEENIFLNNLASTVSKPCICSHFF